MAQGSQEERSCPVDGCDNPEIDEISDMDDQFDWFCHWCGNMFVENEGDLDVQ